MGDVAGDGKSQLNWPFTNHLHLPPGSNEVKHYSFTSKRFPKDILIILIGLKGC